MRELFIANKNYSSWSLRPWVLMRMLDIPFTERLFSFGTDNHERFRAFSPSAKMPTLKDGETTVWDSLAIAEYLAEEVPAAWPADREARAFARSAAAEMHSGFAVLRDVCTMNCGVRVSLTNVPDSLGRDVARVAEIWSDGLSRFGGPFIAGRTFTAVDAMFAPVAFRVQTYGLALPERPAMYVARILDLGPMREWYADALAEPFRDQPHEAELTRFGRVTADLRTA
ncbi:glutathione S-transferase [Antarcticirhabdus aurantiaca]|uniref:Glutathione S-transferase n=1 Tax=Antarcticirhabdus aurantiaca TaxID=2606717 RepID=A0ACD4NS39_9HYPH|nr:glutathione S-transferase [Antarcticirhabdus aurantiaca]WAJ29567.1 glutathione S-transferase [Jeongeuplla avenae]